MPARVNVSVRVPVTKIPVSHDLSSAVAECDTPPSSLVHATDSPTFTVTDAGRYWKSLMSTAAFAASTADAVTIASAMPATTAAKEVARLSAPIR